MIVLQSQFTSRIHFNFDSCFMQFFFIQPQKKYKNKKTKTKNKKNSFWFGSGLYRIVSTSFLVVLVIKRNYLPLPNSKRCPLCFVARHLFPVGLEEQADNSGLTPQVGGSEDEQILRRDWLPTPSRVSYLTYPDSPLPMRPGVNLMKLLQA